MPLFAKNQGFRWREKRAKAAGMMQIMPATAAFISKNRKLRNSERYKLYDPNFNISLGQQYIQHLLNEPLIDIMWHGCWLLIMEVLAI